MTATIKPLTADDELAKVFKSMTKDQRGLARAKMASRVSFDPVIQWCLRIEKLHSIGEATDSDLAEARDRVRRLSTPPDYSWMSKWTSKDWDRHMRRTAYSAWTLADEKEKFEIVQELKGVLVGDER